MSMQSAVCDPCCDGGDGGGGGGGGGGGAAGIYTPADIGSTYSYIGLSSAVFVAQHLFTPRKNENGYRPFNLSLPSPVTGRRRPIVYAALEPNYLVLLGTSDRIFHSL